VFCNAVSLLSLVKLGDSRDLRVSRSLSLKLKCFRRPLKLKFSFHAQPLSTTCCFIFTSFTCYNLTIEDTLSARALSSELTSQQESLECSVEMRHQICNTSHSTLGLWSNTEYPRRLGSIDLWTYLVPFLVDGEGWPAQICFELHAGRASYCCVLFEQVETKGFESHISSQWYAWQSDEKHKFHNYTEFGEPKHLRPVEVELFHFVDHPTAP